MKKTVTLLGIIFVLAALLFAGCAGESAPEPPAAPTPELTPEPTPEEPEFETPVTLPAEVDPVAPSEAEIQAEFATDELLAQFGSYHEFIEPGEEGSPKIILMTNIPVRDFHFVEIVVEIDDDFNIDFYADTVLYTVDELTPDEPFVVTWLNRDEFPHRGISFVDETGLTRFFTIGMGGDGSVWLTELM